MAYFGRMRPQTGLRGESFSADVTVEGPVLRPLDLSVVISKVLLKVRELDERSSAIWEVALIGPLA